MENNKRKYILIIAFISLITGCSVNGFGLPGSVVEKHTYSELSHRIYTQAIGIHLNTRAALAFNIGYIEREVIYPIVTDNLLYCSQKFINTNSTKQILTTFKYSTIPIKTSIQSKGAILSLSPQHLNLSIGYLNRKLLSVEANSSFSMFYNNEDRQALQVCAVIKPKIQGEQHD